MGMNFTVLFGILLFQLIDLSAWFFWLQKFSQGTPRKFWTIIHLLFWGAVDLLIFFLVLTLFMPGIVYFGFGAHALVFGVVLELLGIVHLIGIISYFAKWLVAKLKRGN